MKKQYSVFSISSEYKPHLTRPEALTDALNEEWLKGWSLVSVIVLPGSEDISMVVSREVHVGL